MPVLGASPCGSVSARQRWGRCRIAVPSGPARHHIGGQDVGGCRISLYDTASHAAYTADNERNKPSASLALLHGTCLAYCAHPPCLACSNHCPPRCFTACCPRSRHGTAISCAAATSPNSHPAHAPASGIPPCPFLISRPLLGPRMDADQRMPGLASQSSMRSPALGPVVATAPLVRCRFC